MTHGDADAGSEVNMINSLHSWSSSSSSSS